MMIKKGTKYTLPTVIAFLVITLTIIGYKVFTLRSTIQSQSEEIDALITQNDELFIDLAATSKELNEFLTIEERIMRLGASHTEAVDIIKASRQYSLDPTALAALIASESNFTDTHHDIPTVVGICGINTVANPTLPHNPYTASGNIYCAAYLLRQYLDLYGTYTLAFKRYKGYSNLGYRQALHVQHIRSTI